MGAVPYNLSFLYMDYIHVAYFITIFIARSDNVYSPLSAHALLHFHLSSSFLLLSSSQKRERERERKKKKKALSLSLSLSLSERDFTVVVDHAIKIVMKSDT